jgi:hypothetical protein
LKSSARASSATDSRMPMCPKRPVAICCFHSSFVSPAPTFFCSGRRRVPASTMRVHFTACTSNVTADATIATKSIA